MCGVIAVLRRPSNRPLPERSALLEAMAVAGQALGQGVAGLVEAADRMEWVDLQLRGATGVRVLLRDPTLAAVAADAVAAMEGTIAALEADLDAGRTDLAEFSLELVNAALVRAKDAVWAVSRDRLRTARAVAALAGYTPPAITGDGPPATSAPAAAGRVPSAEPPSASDGPATEPVSENGPGLAAIEGLTSVQVALSALDRLEVRGRDSAGLHLLVTGHGLDFDAPDVKRLLEGRRDDHLFTSSAVRTPGALSFVYKAAAEIGELGDNTAALRAAITADRLLARALQSPEAQVTVLGHTRWASVGIISQANAHPLNSDEDGGPSPDGAYYVTAALNGDVDNYLDLQTRSGLRIPAEITTDAKIIPTLISRRLSDGAALDDAFRETVGSFEGSVAIAASTSARPDLLHLALRGSGQAMYVGLAEDAFVVASEPYGLVEETGSYLRMDGDTTGGQVVVLDRVLAGEIAGIRRYSYGGAPIPLTEDELHHAEITTRDIDRAGYPHFLLKEITEAPRSFRKTLRGKIVESHGQLSADVGDECLPPLVRTRLGDGTIRRILVIGQGTAAVAALSVAAALKQFIPNDRAAVAAVLATELSGFSLEDDMTDTLVVAVSQSGTTTDTNRTVDMVRGRGAVVVAIVNRRNSDLVDKSDGVLYTSDGRDVEMSVASTKAFYAQIAAGFLLALAVAEALGGVDRRASHELLRALRELPDALEQVIARRPAIAEAARLAPSRRYWAVVGNGPNRIAAQEIRIKLSELCYKSIACDATEDKKHIDLSAEPLIFVCAAGLTGANASDVAKEVAIYRAHKAAPIVVATDGEERFSAALSVIAVPAVYPPLAFVLSAMVGHLFGYEAAMAIDAQARSLREVRAAVEASLAGGDALSVLDRLGPLAEVAAQPFLSGLASGAYDGHLEASTAVRVSTLLRYVTGNLPIDAYEREYGKVGLPGALVDDLTAALSKAIDELTRPIDAIKHQAKTVTVGISRSEDSVLGLAVVRQLLACGARRDHLSYRTLRSLAALDPAIAEVEGYTRYRIEGLVGAVPSGSATIHVVDKGGVAVDLRSRTDADPELRGTKHRAATQREVLVARGHFDGRSVVLVPEIKDDQVTGLDLLHVRFAEGLRAETVREVLSGYPASGNRYSALVDAVTETDPFDDARLGEEPLLELLTEPVNVLAARWRRS